MFYRTTIIYICRNDLKQKTDEKSDWFCAHFNDDFYFSTK